MRRVFYELLQFLGNSQQVLLIVFSPTVIYRRQHHIYIIMEMFCFYSSLLLYSGNIFNLDLQFSTRLVLFTFNPMRRETFLQGTNVNYCSFPVIFLHNSSPTVQETSVLLTMSHTCLYCCLQKTAMQQYIRGVMLNFNEHNRKVLK